jgi:diguanylate cyclase (GGDEF)-like protein
MPTAVARKFGFATLVPCGLALLYAIGSALLKRGFALTVFGDLTQCLLLAGCAASALVQAMRSEGRGRLFWSLLCCGFSLWLASQLAWSYYEVCLRQEVPNPFSADVVLYLHIVPLMAALAVRPHISISTDSSRFTSLDFLLLLIWWLYLYAFVVIAWQFDYVNVEMYGKSFDALYLLEHLVFLVALLLVKKRAIAPWKRIYSQLFLAACLYAVSSIAASVAIDYGTYYTGSLYDLPLLAAEAWFLGVGLSGRGEECGEQREAPSKPHTAVWPARISMLTVFSMPLMILWAVFAGHAPEQVRVYRLILTAVAMLVMGAMVFLKQHLLHRELISLLDASHENFNQMRRLKEEVENKEQQLRASSAELQRKNLQLQQVSFTDTLTGVWNRRYLEEILASEVSQSLRNHYRQESASSKTAGELVFIMVDVDYFKHVNDDYGHATGDELLRKFAQRLSRVMRKSDVLIRWGGEEFLVLSRSSSVSGTPVFCQRILEVVASDPFLLGKDIRIRKTCSIGWAAYPWLVSNAEALCAEEVIELADSALYLAKSSGRNQSIGFLPSDAALATADHLAMENLRAAQSELIRVTKNHGPAATLSSTPSQQGTEVPEIVSPGG